MRRVRRFEIRTALTIDADIDSSAKSLAARQNKTFCEIISALSRQTLDPAATGHKTRTGLPLLPVRVGVARRGSRWSWCMNCATCCLDDVMLDVNVQPSRLDPAHVHDDADHECFAAHKHKARATCALT